MDRRKFLQRSLLGSLWLWLTGQGRVATAQSTEAQTTEKPNILWITSEDHGPHLGCYGDLYADTPTLDQLARQGMRFKRAWSSAPVCGSARTALISGVYPPSLGAEHMRSLVPMPAFMKMYPQYLRDEGYYCTNNVKEDYNLIKPGQVWDDSSSNGHWRNRPAGQPFFAVFNYTMTHEGQIRDADADTIHDPAGVRIPAYMPDTPEVRSNWAQYYDRLTQLDDVVEERLAELEDAGQAEDTIIIFCSDHGSGIPRSKRWPYNSGMQVPFIIYFPDKWRHLALAEYEPGGESDRLIDFLDVAPTLLSLAGLETPDYMHGRAFAGPYQQATKTYLHAFRGRIGERYELSRAVTDGRYLYMRHYMPHKPYGQYVAYMFQTQATQAWKQLYDEGRLNDVQSRFWQPKPSEELYDLENDPDEINDLAGSPAHRDILERLRDVQRQWLLETRDYGLLPEHEIHARAPGMTPFEAASDDNIYPLQRILRIAELASSREPENLDELLDAFDDADSAVRYWAAMGLLIREEAGVSTGADRLRSALDDPAPTVRITAAGALGQFGNAEDITAALAVLSQYLQVEESEIFLALMALDALDAMEEKASPLAAQIEELSVDHMTRERPNGNFILAIKDKILADLG